MRTIIRLTVGIVLMLTLMLIQISLVWAIYIQIFAPIPFLAVGAIVFLTNASTFIVFAILTTTTPKEEHTL